MKGLLFPKLGKNLNHLIERFFISVDLCLMRATCTAWWHMIPPQKLSFEKDFCEIPVYYDRLEYILQIEKWITFCGSAKSVWERFANMQYVMKAAQIHTLLFYCRKVSVRPEITTVWSACKFEEFDTILLPILMCKLGARGGLFWHIFLEGDSKSIDWMFEKGFVKNYSAFFMYAPKIAHFNEKAFENMNHICKTKKSQSWLWEKYSKLLWQSFAPDVVHLLLRFAQICRYVPDETCSLVSKSTHKEMLEICGCQPMVIYKKMKKE